MSDSCVYVTDKEFGWLPANVVSQDETKATVKVFDSEGKNLLGERQVMLKDYPNQALPLQNVDASGNLMQMPDMVDLPSLHEAAILYNLRARHQTLQPYTRVGDLIIAVNPFQWMQDLYSEEQRNAYVDRFVYNAGATGGGEGGTLPPHVYETSCGAYRGLAVDGKHQSILVSGESGAGKTETVKIVMSHLSSVNAGSSESPDGSDKNHHLVVQRVLDAQPLLEAFGNAKTVRNDNSSRFGKFIQMQFDVEDATQAAFSGRAIPSCVLAGSTCETYLLEKSRVVSHEHNERTYHVFYQLLMAPDDRKKQFWPYLVGKQPKDFKYVGDTDLTLKIDGMTDVERFMRTEKALELLNIQGDKLTTLYVALCCVMQLGNIEFGPDPEDDEKSVITTRDELKYACDVLGVPEDVLEKSLTYRTVTAGKESYSVPMKVDSSQDGRDAFAKEIYQQIFDWLVREINVVTCAEANYADARDVEEYGLIGLLDIFGFESFEVNRFEQLCINYTNEKLQQKYTLDIFRSVQEEYSDEGIELGEIPFEDNTEVLRLIEGKIGIIAVLNEECVRPKGNDTSFVSKVKTVNKEVTCLVNKKLHKPKEFGIVHYAGPVTYDASNFVQKNTDALPNDLIACACKSTNDLIKVELKAAADAKMSSGGRVGKRGAATLTVATKFKSQLTRLMADITKTKTRYIRCIKPNPEKVPIKMEMFSSAEQLRCAGVVAAVTISRVAFPNRLMHETALERFSCLSNVNLEKVVEEKKEETEDDGTGYRDAVISLLDGLLQPMETTKDDGRLVKAFETGKSRVYFRTGALEFLEAKRLVALGVFATAIERIVRGFVARALFWKTKGATIVSQANARRTIARKAFLKSKHAVTTMQCWTRCVYAKRELIRLQREKASIQIQSRWRTVMAMTNWAKQRNAAITMQKTVRGAIQRPKYRQALKEAEEEARVNSKLAALQKRLQEAEMKWFKADKQRIEAEKRAEGLSKEATPTPAPHGVSEEEKKSDSGTDAQRQELIDESNEMLEYFRKEVFKLKSANYLLRTDYSSLKEQHKRLKMHAESVEASSSALKQNLVRLSNTNRSLAYQVAEQKDLIGKLNQDVKMEKIRHLAELKRRREELLGRSKMHEAEMNRFKRENERLREIIAKGPDADKAPPQFERASFQRSTQETLLAKTERKLIVSSGNVPPGYVGAVTPDNMSVGSGGLEESDDEHDAYLERSDPNMGFDPRTLRRWHRPRRPPFRFGYSGGRHRFHSYQSWNRPTMRNPAPLSTVPGSSLGSASARGGNQGNGFQSPFAPIRGGMHGSSMKPIPSSAAGVPGPRRAALKVNTGTSLGGASLKGGSSLRNAAKLGASNPSSSNNPISVAPPAPAPSTSSSLAAASSSSLGAAVRKGANSSLSQARLKSRR